MTTSATADVANDRPVMSKQEDRLNRAAFAERIAGMLSSLPDGAGVVVGIHGPWGDGKTTVLNLLRRDLTVDDRVVVREFNPWRLTDDESMLRGFFLVLADAIEASLSTKLERTKTIAGKVCGFFRFIVRPVAWFFKPAETLEDLLAKFSELATACDSVGLEELRARIIGHLSRSPKRVVMIIDDIDRLDKNETYLLFRLIKACADFPNVCYVLAFDDTAVARALGERYGGGDEVSGRAFLEKVIQIPLTLPVAAKEDLRSLCFEYVEKALNATDIDLTRDQAGEFVMGFDRGVGIRLTTARAAKRFVNGLAFALPMLKGETNPVDLLLIEALRAFFPEVYEVVRSNHTEFAGVESDRVGGRAAEARSAQLLKPVLAAMPQEHAESVKALLCSLFPRLSSAYGKPRYGSDWLSHWRQDRRICSPEYCARYFAYAIPLNDVADCEIASLLDAAGRGKTDFVQAWLGGHLSGAKAARVISKLRHIESTVDPAAAEGLAVAVAQLGKTIPNTKGFFPWGEPPSQAALLISHLLRRLPDGRQRLDVAKRVITVADPVWFAAECLRWMHVTDKPGKQDINTLSKKEADEVRLGLVWRIKRYAATGAALFDPGIEQEDTLLYEWMRVEGRKTVQAHLISVFSKDGGQVARFLESQAPVARNMDGGIPHIGELEAEQLKNMKYFIDLDVLAEWVLRCCPGDFVNPQWDLDSTKPIEERLAEQFMYIYSKWKKEGEPPDTVSDADEPKSAEQHKEENEEGEPPPASPA